MFDWQTILVGCALLLACIYVGWRGWSRLSSLSTSRRMNASSCSDGCGGCGATQPMEDDLRIADHVPQLFDASGRFLDRNRGRMGTDVFD
jgi:hypothetical protein